MASASIGNVLQLLLLALLHATSFVSAQWYIPENGQGFLSAGCKNWFARPGEMILTADW